MLARVFMALKKKKKKKQRRMSSDSPQQGGQNLHSHNQTVNLNWGQRIKTPQWKPKCQKHILSVL